MGKVIGTCGHELTHAEFDYSFSWKESTREGNPAIAYGSLCEKCAQDYRKHKLLIKKFHYEKGEVATYQEYDLK